MYDMKTQKALVQQLPADASLEEIINAFLIAADLSYLTPSEVLEGINTYLLDFNSAETFEGRMDTFNYHFSSEVANPSESEVFLRVESMSGVEPWGLLRLFADDVTYLWLAYTASMEGRATQGGKSPVTFLAAAISAYDQPSETLTELTLKGESTKRLLTTYPASFWFTSDLGTGLSVTFVDQQTEGLFNVIHPQVTIEGQSVGYYFTF